MGLDDLKDGDGVDDSTSSSRQYVKPNREDMRVFFSDRPEEWRNANHPSKEYVVETNEFLPEYGNIVLRCFTTLLKSTGEAADKGADAIRTVVWDMEMDRPIAGREKTLRIKTWRKNLNEKLDDLMERQEEIVTFCDNCGGNMVIRDGQYGKFFGCSNYPDCTETKEIQ